MNTTNTTGEGPDYFQDTKRKLRQYINKRILLIRLQATEKFSKIASIIVNAIVIVLIGLFLLIFGSITLGYWLASLTGSFTIGFGIVALIYLVIFLFVVFFMRKILQNFFINVFIKLLHKKD